MMPLLPASFRERPLARILSQQTLWALSISAIATSSVLLGFAVAMNLKVPVQRPGSDPNDGCDNKNDPAFWQGLGQVLLRVLLVICLLVSVLRDREDKIKVDGKFIFYIAIAVGIVSEILALVLYGVICGSGGWLAMLLLQWAASVAAAAAAAQLAGGISK
ncbi:hypothetical protein F5X99DRAFT_425645 [Biscogniauxia marginata]|nr:hypothetical protein F5X99DRAFT_425645 [Biscogniauxia marginata]